MDSKADIGDVVAVPNKHGEPMLAVIVGRAAHLQYPLLVAADGYSGWVADRDILDRQPPCPTCGKADRWTALPGATVVCLACHPTTPDWDQWAAHLSTLVAAIDETEPTWRAVQRHVGACTQAYLAKDVQAWRRHAITAQWLLLTAQGTPEANHDRQWS